MNKETAKEMFRKLGFTEMCSIGTFTIKLYRNSKLMSIYFDYDHTIDMEGCNITMELLQAINKQVEELGWNNE